MLLSNTARRTRVAPQSGQGLPTLLEEWHQEAASGGFRRSLSLMDQFQSLTPRASVWITSIARWGDAELLDLRQVAKVLRQALRPAPVTAADHHAILKRPSVIGQALRQVSDGKAVPPDQLANVIFGHHGFPLKLERMLGVKLARQLPFNGAECR